MKEIKEKIKIVEEMVGPVYLVGGSVRDLVLNREGNDLDFATPLLPDEIEAAIKKAGRKPHVQGKKFGTVGLSIDGEIVEITTFRSEKYKPKDRKPDVEFVEQLSSDLARRDFTINAMAMKPNGKIIDPYGGKEDIERRFLKCVGIPSQRFREDPLRMLRACRFVSQLGFTINLPACNSITKLSHHILDIAKERWVMEMDKLLMGDYVSDGLAYMWALDLFKFMIPELHLQKNFNQNTTHHVFDLHEHTKRVVAACPKDLDLRWAALLHDVAKPFVFIDKGDRYIYPFHEEVGAEMVEKIGLHMKWKNERIKKVKLLVLEHLKEESPLRKYDNMSKK